MEQPPVVKDILVSPKQFRVWDTEHKKMLYPGTSFPMSNMGLVFTSRRFLVMQYVGQKDTAGKKMYELDIITQNVQNEFGSWEMQTGVVEFNLGLAFAIRLNWKNGYGIGTAAHPTVIGNMLEHESLIPPEFAKGQIKRVV